MNRTRQSAQKAGSACLGHDQTPLGCYAQGRLCFGEHGTTSRRSFACVGANGAAQSQSLLDN